MEDELVSSLPIHFSNSLDGLIHIHQYPLLSRPIQTPPSATSAGRHVTARIKPASRRIEVHVPTDIRPDVWNNERGQMLGHARLDDDRERNQITNADDHPNITEVRLRSEEIVQQGTHMLGVIRDG
jgi:DNA-directed RNA polymerase-3 subunit RPC5